MTISATEIIFAFAASHLHITHRDHIYVSYAPIISNCHIIQSSETQNPPTRLQSLSFAGIPERMQ